MIETLGFWPLLIAGVAFFLGGFVKGAVGFALPLVAVSGAASVLPKEAAVAMIIFPVLLSNVWQAARQGFGPFLETLWRFWPMNLVLLVTIWFSAGLLPGLEDWIFFAALGGVVALFAGMQLFGWSPKLPERAERPTGVGVGLLGGLSGGIAGIWGPPVILYLIALRLPKTEQVRAAGVCFALGAVVLAPAHALSGVLDRDAAILSAAAILPTLIGQWLGQSAQDRMDLALFRRITLIVLCVTAVNLLRRAIFG